jgi:hypothetical protein
MAIGVSRKWMNPAPHIPIEHSALLKPGFVLGTVGRGAGCTNHARLADHGHRTANDPARVDRRDASRVDIGRSGPDRGDLDPVHGPVPALRHRFEREGTAYYLSSINVPS